MSTQPQYANTPHVGVGLVTTGDTSRTAPTNFATVFTAGANGSRIERINMTGIGATVASMVRLFLVPGTPGATISGITFAGTTATVTTATAHGLSTGALVTVQGASPVAYNVTNAAITVTGATTFTYAMASTPTASATATGYYASTPAALTYNLWQETPVSAVTPSSSVPVFSSDLSNAILPSRLPIVLAPGWSLRATVNDTQTGSGVNIIAAGGDF